MQVSIYMTFAAQQFEGTIECYGNITDKFQTCNPSTSAIVDYIGDVCGSKRYNKESVGIRGVIRDDDGTLGMAWTLPDVAVKRELFTFTCHVGARDEQRKWHVFIALFQRMNITANFVRGLERLYPKGTANYSASNCLVPLIENNENEQKQQNGTFVAILAVALALNVVLMVIILIGSLLLYKLVNRIRQRGSFGFYFKAGWLFVPKLAKNELNNTLIDIEHLIYSGPNSRVYFARYRFSPTAYRSVVAKVPSCDAFHLSNIVGETRINAQLRHPRVVEYVGFYRDAFDDVRIVSEFMAGGDLHSFLVDKQNKINVGHLFNFIGQIAEGMEYLISKRIIHRDLAARNCMLNEEGTSIKIADFGLSRHFNADANYTSSSPVRLPLRWMALECFDENGEILHHCKFNEKTDVWSFGVVVWECFARGAQPYGSDDFQKVIADLKRQLAIDQDKRYVDQDKLYGGDFRLGCPEKCPQMLYDQLMLKCWADRQQMRPAFSIVRAKLDEIFDGIIGIYPDTFIQIVK
uniref:Protein kinase domain-containing protein n=1 Tax=Globodera rostochiensis TaxID=31243 RepID=A0A914I6D9_GLORO